VEVEDGIVQFPIHGFIQSKSVALSVWHDWLGEDQAFLEWTKISGPIEFTSEYQQAITLLNDSSQGWFPLKAGIRKRFSTFATGWALSGSIQVQASSSSSNLLSVVTDTFIKNHLPTITHESITFFNMQCDVTPLAQFDQTSNKIISVDIRGFLQTNQTKILPLIEWLRLFSFVGQPSLHPLKNGLGDDAEFQATRSATASSADASPWFTIHEAGKFKTKQSARKSTVVQASDGHIQTYS